MLRGDEAANELLPVLRLRDDERKQGVPTRRVDDVRVEARSEQVGSDAAEQLAQQLVRRPRLLLVLRRARPGRVRRGGGVYPGGVLLRLHAVRPEHPADMGAIPHLQRHLRAHKAGLPPLQAVLPVPRAVLPVTAVSRV